jgi:hypothetical protein
MYPPLCFARLTYGYREYFSSCCKDGILKLEAGCGYRGAERGCDSPVPTHTYRRVCASVADRRRYSDLVQRGIIQWLTSFIHFASTYASQSDICETTEGVRSYSGYVHLPAGSLADLGVQNQTYEINTFFWFFESRKDPQNAPLSIWMNGGPGSSSMLGLLRENGPCFVNSDSNSTYLNEWSWNNEGMEI